MLSEGNPVSAILWFGRSHGNATFLDKETLLPKKAVNFMEYLIRHKMDIAVKYRIISEIINTNDERILNAVKSLLNIVDQSIFGIGKR